MPHRIGKPFSSSIAPFFLRGMLAVFLAVSSARAGAAPKVIHETPSRFGDSVVVTDDGDRLRSLRFGRDGEAQTTIRVGDPDHLHLQYARVVLAGLALVEDVRSVLIVGLGGAALPVFLRKHFQAMTIDVVEIDPAVVAAAKLHFGFREDERMRAHVADGRAYIENAARGRYDMIILDAYGSDATPPHLTTLQFLQAVRKATARDGVVVSSFWVREKNPKYDAMVRTYREVFGALYLVEAPEKANHVLFALPRAKGPDRASFAAAAKRISSARRFRFDLGELVERGFIEASTIGRNSAVLLDARKPPPR
jgi:spermidine synthase